MDWLGILVFLAAVGALTVVAWRCGLYEAKPPFDPTIGFRDPDRDYWELYRARHLDPPQTAEVTEGVKARSVAADSDETSH